MTFENMDLGDDLGDEGGTPPEESSNRMFLIVAGVLGAIALLALICIAVYAFVLLPRNRDAQHVAETAAATQKTAVADIIQRTSTAAALAEIRAAYSATPTATSVPDTATPTLPPTSVVAVVGSATPATATLQPDMLTATALYPTLTYNAVLFAGTQTAQAKLGTQAVPTTGFADEVGLPLMLGIAVLLLVVIFLARRLRTA
jgi:cytoskeletal protein RodZ